MRFWPNAVWPNAGMTDPPALGMWQLSFVQDGWKPTRNVSASPMLEVHLPRCEQVVQGSACQIRTQRRQVGRSPQSWSPTQSSRKSSFFCHDRFEILSSDDDEPLIPSTVPASSRAIRNIVQPVQEEFPVTLLDALEFDHATRRQ